MTKVKVRDRGAASMSWMLVVLASAQAARMAKRSGRGQLRGSLQRRQRKSRSTSARSAHMGASVDELLIAGLRATVAPILDIQGRLALSSPSWRHALFDPADDAVVTAQLGTLCRRLIENIAGRWPASG